MLLYEVIVSCMRCMMYHMYVLVLSLMNKRTWMDLLIFVYSAMDVNVLSYALNVIS